MCSCVQVNVCVCVCMCVCVCVCVTTMNGEGAPLGPGGIPGRGAKGGPAPGGICC